MLRPVTVKTVLNKHKQRDSWFPDDYSVNPYEGCSCNCLYCYVRGSRYGENIQEKMGYKENLLPLLEKQLQNRAKKGEYGFVALGTSTDAYLAQEKELGLTRRSLELMLKYRFPVFISTKQNLIERDLDLLKEINEKAVLPDDLSGRLPGVLLSVSLSVLDNSAAALLEPGAAAPTERLQLVRHLRKQGFTAGINAMPLLPFISDTDEELEKMIAAAARHDASYILCAGLTLFGNGPADSRTLYFKFLQRNRPDLIPAYHKLYRGSSYPPLEYQKKLNQKTTALCRKYEIKNSIL